MADEWEDVKPKTYKAPPYSSMPSQATDEWEDVPKQAALNQISASQGKPWARRAIETALPYAKAAIAGPQTQLGSTGAGDYSPLAQNLMNVTGSKPAASLRNLPQAVPQMPASSRLGPVIGAGAALAQPAIDALGLKPTKPFPEKNLGYAIVGAMGPGGEEGLASKALDKAIDKGIAKGIRPSAVGIQDYRGFKNYLERARDAVKTIFSSKEALNLTDEYGEKIQGLPKTLDQFSQAVAQTKANIFKQYDAMAQAAGEAKARVALNPIAKELDKVAADRINQKLHPEVVKYALEKAQALKKLVSMTPEEIQDEIAHSNAITKAYQQNPNPSAIKQTAIEALYGNQLRKALDARIESAIGPGYQALKNKYGALKTIEKDVAHRAVIDARKNNKQLIDFSDIGSAAELAQGLITMNPAAIGTAAAIKGVSTWYKYLNNPNTAIKNMFAAFEGVEKAIPSIGKAAQRGLMQAGAYRAGQAIQPQPGTMQKVGKALDPAAQAQAMGTPPGGNMYNRPNRPEPQESPAAPALRAAMAAYGRPGPGGPDYDGAIKALSAAIQQDPSRAEYFKNQIQNLIREKKAQEEIMRRKGLGQYAQLPQ